MSDLNTDHDTALDALVHSTCELTGFPLAAVTLLDAQREWVRAAQGWPDEAPRQVPRDTSFAHQLLADEPATSAIDLSVADARADRRFQHHPWVTGVLQLRSYLAEPLRVRGAVVGMLCVMDREPRQASTAQRDALRRMARVAAELLMAHEHRLPAHEEHGRLLDFARASGDWMWETDAQLRYTWVSNTFEAITGLSAQAILGQQVADVPLLDGLGQPLGGGQSFHALLARRQPLARTITPKQTPRGLLHVSRSAVPVYDAGGAFAGYRGTARDVTAHVAAERRTHGRAELLRKLSAEVPGVFFQFWLKPDQSLSYSYVSDAVRDVFGAEPPHLGDGDPGMVCRMLHAEDQAGFMRSLVDAGRALKPWQREYRVTRPDGSLRWLETRAVPEPHPAGGTLWHGFTSDVTARKEIELALRSSEERWSMAAAAAGIGIAQYDLRSGLVALDARACVNHGLEFPQPGYTLNDWVAAMHPDDRERAQQRVAQVLANGALLDERYRLERPDGRSATLEMFARRTLDDKGQVTGLLGTCRDVTQQVAHEQLRADKEAAERASQAKSEFLSRVSHELRTPLNGILGFAQLMAVDRVNPLAPEQARRLDSVMRAGRHLLELINDMLNLARIEQQDFSLTRAPVHLNALVDTSFALVQPLAAQAGVLLRPPPRQPLWAQADARAVEQVLLNLLSNAIKYNRPGGTVEVALSRRGDRVAVAIRDEGEGLSADQQSRLFQPFNRLGAEQRRVEGTGLGLVIARELAASMKGELQVHSEPGQGSTFTLLLPAGDAPEGPDATESGSGPAPQAQAPSRRRVLYIEDEPLNVLLMQEVFKARPQWELQVATDGRSGLTAAQTQAQTQGQTQAHDLLLIDMNLPDMNGLELIRQLRADAATRGLHCIALSADAMQPQIDAALAAGFDGYWTKPINVAHILSGLEQVLGSPGARPERP